MPVVAAAGCTQRARGTIDIDLNVFTGPVGRARADLEEMAGVGTLDVDRLLGVLVRYLDPTTTASNGSGRSSDRADR